MEMMEDDQNGVYKDGSNSVSLWYILKAGGTYSASVQQQKLGGDGVYFEDPGGVYPPGGQTFFGGDGETCGGWDMVISTGGGDAISSRLIPHVGVHSETTGDHSGTGGMTAHI